MSNTKYYTVIKDIPGASVGDILYQLDLRSSIYDEASKGDLCHVGAYSTVVGNWFVDKAIADGFIKKGKSNPTKAGEK